MARLVPYTALSAATAIDGTDCMGDSRVVINTNFQNLETILARAVTIDVGRLTIRASGIFGIPRNTPTTYTKVLSVFNAAGNYEGFIPIYQ